MVKQIFKHFKPIHSFYWTSRKAIWRFKRAQQLKDYLNHCKEVRKLQIGSSSNVLNGWFNTDLLPFYNGALFLDATELFPFEDNTFDYIFSEHMIEHITYKEGLSMLRECYRVLKPGGKIRIATPDLEIIAGIYAKDKSESQKQYIKSVVDMWLTDVGVYQECFVINQIFGFGHEFIYDYQILKYALETVGFVKISRCEPGESNEEVFQNIDIHKNDYIKFETMVLEAKRPHERIGQ